MDTSAPVQASASIRIDASAEAVWRVLADVESWPDFIPGVTRARWIDASAPLAERAFSWRNGTTVHSVMAVAEPGRELTWTGVALWLVAVHRNEIEPLGEERCRLTSSESMAGLGVRLALPASRLQSQLETFVAAVGSEARRRRP